MTNAQLLKAAKEAQTQQHIRNIVKYLGDDLGTGKQYLCFGEVRDFARHLKLTDPKKRLSLLDKFSFIDADLVSDQVKLELYAHVRKLFWRFPEIVTAIDMRVDGILFTA